ncbi:MAG: HIT family protein [archaeon]
MEECIFCKIASGEIPASKVYEDQRMIAFLDIMPASLGHTLIVPKKHYAHLEDADRSDFAAAMALARRIANSVKKAIACDGVNVLINNREAAGQVVPHLHIHVIPRWKGDCLKFDWPHMKYGEGQMKEYQDKIASSI